MDNHPVHVSHLSTIKMKELGFNKINHPSYRPCLSHPDYWLFPQLKATLKGRVFHDENELDSALRKFFESKPIEWYEKGIKLYKDKLNKLIEKGGDYLHD